VIEGLKALQKKEKRSLSQLASELLTDALAARNASDHHHGPTLRWTDKPMGARVDLSDKESLYRILDAP